MHAAKTRRDRDARRDLILDAAQGMFLEEGFAMASMSTLAACLGGSKGTLYNDCKIRGERFNADVERRCLWQDKIFVAPVENETTDEASPNRPSLSDPSTY